PGLGRRTGALAGRAAGPGPEAEGRDAVWRAACPARAYSGCREAAGAADPGRAGGPPRSAGPPRVPPGPDGSRRRAAGQRRALLAPDQRPGTRLRLRDRAG